MDTSWYYQQELHQLRTLATEFAKKHPDVAPLLAGASSDPDVERLLEGTAFLTGLLTQKIEQTYDNIAENLCALAIPQMLCPVPSCTMIQFFPKKALSSQLLIEKGSSVSSVENNGVACIYTTSSDVQLLPLQLSSVNMLTSTYKHKIIELKFSFTGTKALDGVDRLRLYFQDSHGNAALKLFSLLFYTQSIEFLCGDQLCTLPGNTLVPVGFHEDEHLFPEGDISGNGYKLLQEYYAFSNKFLFLDIVFPQGGIHSEGQQQLTCSFNLSPTLPDDFPSYALQDFALFTTPAVNIFPYETRPIKADFRSNAYDIRANTSKANAYEPYKVLKVTQINALGEEIEYLPMLAASAHTSHPTYNLHFEKKQDGNRQMQLEVLYPFRKNMPETSTLSLEVLYSNGNLANALNVGDVTVPLSTTSVLTDFTNITPPTKAMQAPSAGHIYWAMLAHLHLNFLPVINAQTLKAILLTYMPTKYDAIYINAIKQHINAIISVTSAQVDVLWRGIPQHGTDLTVTLGAEGFSNIGSMYLFGAVIARFLHECSPVNSFLRVIISDSLNKRSFKWEKHRPVPYLL